MKIPTRNRITQGYAQVRGADDYDTEALTAAYEDGLEAGERWATTQAGEEVLDLRQRLELAMIQIAKLEERLAAMAAASRAMVDAIQEGRHVPRS